jgi:hypothetical protein
MKGLDVLDQLVRQLLDGLLAGPGHMRRQDEIGQLQQLHQDAIGGRRLGRSDVETRAAQLAKALRAGQLAGT